MTRLEEFMKLLVGKFNNKEQYEEMKEKEISFPYAEHINTACNDKIVNLPNAFKGIFMLEESYYTINGNTHASPHLFLFTEEKKGIVLTSYDLPKEYDKNTLTYSDLKEVHYENLKKSSKFTPVLYQQMDDKWEGGSVSMFSPIIKFTLFERFSNDYLRLVNRWK